MEQIKELGGGGEGGGGGGLGLKVLGVCVKSWNSHGF